jgi:hypothetical protein
VVRPEVVRRRLEQLAQCLTILERYRRYDRAAFIAELERFGSAPNLNIHFQMLIPDGVYTVEQNGSRFHRVGAPDP